MPTSQTTDLSAGAAHDGVNMMLVRGSAGLILSRTNNSSQGDDENSGVSTAHRRQNSNQFNGGPQHSGVLLTPKFNGNSAYSYGTAAINNVGASSMQGEDLESDPLVVKRPSFIGEAEAERVGAHMPLCMFDHRNAFAVLFAVFINLLDACTFGTILFPPDLAAFAPIGISSFLLSTAIVQFIFVLGSDFRCGLGTGQAENLPFLHLMAQGIVHQFHKGGLGPEAALPSVLVAYSMSTILTGLLFYLTGWLRLGRVLSFVPRHIIVGFIGGFGAFLLVTAFEISTGLPLSEMSMQTAITALFQENVRILWISVAILQVGLQCLGRLEGAEMLTPLYMMLIPLGFYAVLYCIGMTTDEARDLGWLFPKPPPTDPRDLWRSFSAAQIDWSAVAGQISTMTNLSFFLLVLVPIRIPTLALTTGEEVDFNREIKAHGLSNIAAGACGSVHNYLSYSNSVFYFNCGGRGRFSQVAVTMLTLLMFLVGPSLINYIPRCVAGCVMATLGCDLLQDALWSSRLQLDAFEYVSVLIISGVIALQGFIPGLETGAVLACATFVLQSSRTSPVRATFTGGVRSNTLYDSHQAAKLESLSAERVRVVQLQGNVFFGNVQQVIDCIKDELSETGGTLISPVRARTSSAVSNGSGTGLQQPNHIMYLVIDCTFVSTLDSTAMAELVKLQRQLLESWTPPIDTTFAGLQPSATVQLVKFQRLQGLETEEEEIMRKHRSSGSKELTVMTKPDMRKQNSFKFDSRRRGSTSSFHIDVNEALKNVEEDMLNRLERQTSIGGPEDEANHSEKSKVHRKLEKMIRKITPEDTPQRTITALAALMTIEEVSANEILWRGQTKAEKACLLLSGSLVAQLEEKKNKRWSPGSRDENVQRKVVQTIFPGNMCGELGLLCNKMHSRTVVACEPSVIAVLSRTVVDNLNTRGGEGLELLNLLQSIALSTAYVRSQELSLFSAGTMRSPSHDSVRREGGGMRRSSSVVNI